MLDCCFASRSSFNVFVELTFSGCCVSSAALNLRYELMVYDCKFRMPIHHGVDGRLVAIA